MTDPTMTDPMTDLALHTAGDMGTRHWPTEIRLEKAEKKLVVEFDDGSTFDYPAEYLRVMSPSAEVQGHSPSQRVTVGGRLHVGIMALEAVGNYAIRITFDDMHDSGIFSWNYLHRLGTERDALWAAYLAELDEKGMSRDPRAGR